MTNEGTMNHNPDIPDTKTCARCKLNLPATDFGYDGRTRDRLTYRCNTCRSQPADTFTTTHRILGDM